MTHSKTQPFTYWKEASNGLIAHVYEHVASNYITDYLVKHGLFFIADFDHWARTYGTVLYLDFKTHNNKADRTLKKALAEFKKTALSLDQVKHAALQVAIEYDRPLTQIEQAFVDEIRVLHTQPWVDMNELTALQATEETSVNTVFASEGIRYGRKTSKSFVESTLHFEIDEKFYTNNPAAKALAVLLIQAVALNIHRLLDYEYTYYDAGDEWDWGAETVAYRTKIVFSKAASPSIQELEQKIITILDSLNNGALANKLERLIHKAYIDEQARYFSLEAMNEITNGIIIGYAGWKSVAQQAQIQSLLDNIIVKVL